MTFRTVQDLEPATPPPMSPRLVRYHEHLARLRVTCAVEGEESTPERYLLIERCKPRSRRVKTFATVKDLEFRLTEYVQVHDFELAVDLDCGVTSGVVYKARCPHFHRR